MIRQEFGVDYDSSGDMTKQIESSLRADEIEVVSAVTHDWIIGNLAVELIKVNVRTNELRARLAAEEEIMRI